MQRMRSYGRISGHLSSRSSLYALGGQPVAAVVAVGVVVLVAVVDVPVEHSALGKLVLLAAVPTARQGISILSIWRRRRRMA